MSPTPTRTLDTQELEQRVKHMYEEVARDPHGEFHFETGRPLAERLGYPPADLDRIPAAAIDSFAGVGHFLDLAAIEPGETVLDLGSGSGMDSFLAALAVGSDGHIVGVDITDEQLAKARRLAAEAGTENVEFREGYIENPRVDAEAFDCVISNGVINLSPDKPAVFAAVARALRPGGRLALADIVSSQQLPEGVTCDASLWAACIGGAMQRDGYREAIRGAGLEIVDWQENEQYRFVSERADNAVRKYGVKSISLLARRPVGRDVRSLGDAAQEESQPALPVASKTDGHQAVVVLRPMELEVVAQIQERRTQNPAVHQQKRDEQSMRRAWSQAGRSRSVSGSRRTSACRQTGGQPGPLGRRRRTRTRSESRAIASPRRFMTTIRTRTRSRPRTLAGPSVARAAGRATVRQRPPAQIRTRLASLASGRKPRRCTVVPETQPIFVQALTPRSCPVRSPPPSAV